MKWTKRRITDELSENNVKLITQYDMEMVRQSIAIATRQKHLRTLLGLSRLLQKDWKSVTKNDIEKLVYDIMQNHADPSANKFANPKIKTIPGDNPAPTTPATIAKVVTAPSMEP